MLAGGLAALLGTETNSEGAALCEVVGPCPPTSESSSMDLDHVYWMDAARPLCRRRRNRMRPASRDKSPPEVRYVNPTGQEGHGFAEPTGQVLGRNSCRPCVPWVPRYVTLSCSEPGRSRCTLSCQFCA